MESLSLSLLCRAVFSCLSCSSSLLCDPLGFFRASSSSAASVRAVSELSRCKCPDSFSGRQRTLQGLVLEHDLHQLFLHLLQLLFVHAAVHSPPRLVASPLRVFLLRRRGRQAVVMASLGGSAAGTWLLRWRRGRRGPCSASTRQRSRQPLANHLPLAKTKGHS